MIPTKGVKIEKGIPLPAPIETSFTNLVRKLEVGDSIFLAGKSPGSFGWVTKFVPTFKLAMRSVEGGTRIWRLK